MGERDNPAAELGSASAVTWIDFEPSRSDEILYLARQEEITPQEAEAMAAAEGLPPFEQQPELPAFDPMEESRWSIVMAVAWIAWRDIDLVRENCPGFRSKSTHWIFREWNSLAPNGVDVVPQKGWFLETWSDATTFRLLILESIFMARAQLPSSTAMTVDQAEKALWQALSESRLVAEGLNRDGVPVDIPAREWSYLKLFEDGRRDVLKYDALDRLQPYTDVKLRREQLMAEWPAPAATVKAQQDCYRWLLDQMRRSLTRRPKPKGAFWRDAQQKFKPIARRQFIRAWDNAIKDSGAASWSKPGRLANKSNRSTS